MRRAFEQPRLTDLREENGKIYGIISASTYDPFDLYSRGVVPHLVFASANDPIVWLRDYGPLWGCSEEDTGAPYATGRNAFCGAQRRLQAVLNLYRCLCGRNDEELRKAYVEATLETGIVTTPDQGTLLNLNPEWQWEASDQEDMWDFARIVGMKDAEDWAAFDGKHPYGGAKDFAESASRKALGKASEELLKWAFVERLKGIQPDFENRRGFHNAWTYRNLLQTFYLMLYFDITGKKGIRACLECRQFFYPTAKRGRFCSGDCSRRNRQKRYWKRRGKFVRRQRGAREGGK